MSLSLIISSLALQLLKSKHLSPEILERKTMEDYRLPAPLVGMLKHTKITGMPVVQTDLQATKLSVTIIWDLATSAPKKSKKQPAKKKPSKPSAPSTTTKPPTSKPAKKTPTPTRQPTPPTPQRPTPTTPRQPTPTSPHRPETPKKRRRTQTVFQQRAPPQKSPMQTDPPVSVQPSPISTPTKGQPQLNQPSTSEQPPDPKINHKGKPFKHYSVKGYDLCAGYEDHENSRAIFAIIHPTDNDRHYLLYDWYQPQGEEIIYLFKNPDSKYYVHDWYSEIKTATSKLDEITNGDVFNNYIMNAIYKCPIHRAEPADDAT